MKLDILKYFTMILICRIIQKKNTLLNRQFSNGKKLLALSLANRTSTKYGILILFCQLKISAAIHIASFLMFGFRQHVIILPIFRL